MIVADGLVPIRHQAISNYHADLALSPVSHDPYSATFIYQFTVNKPNMFERGLEVTNLRVSLLLVVSSSHRDKAISYAADP